jgi:hypothetical protein
MESNSLIVIDKVEDLGQMEALVSTESKFEKLNISIQTGLGQPKQERDVLEDLINIKYMRLQELKLTIEMGKVTDRHIFVISEALEKNKHMKTLSLNLWKYIFINAAIRSPRWGSRLSSRPSRAI